tara:strand:+ start:944 stop:1129 length:186 start_codon:yes stop_codon:yes gene_type:complete
VASDGTVQIERLAAAQAAQKAPTLAGLATIELAAAQAAQKRLRRIERCCQTLAAAQAAQKS